MSNVTVALKFICLLVGIAYSVPVVIGGARGLTVSQTHTFLFAFSWSGFITLQWLL